MPFKKKLLFNLPWLSSAAFILYYSHQGVYGLGIMEIKPSLRYTLLSIALCLSIIQSLIWKIGEFYKKINLAGLSFCYINLFFYTIIINIISAFGAPPIYYIYVSTLINGLSTLLIIIQSTVWLILLFRRLRLF
jgi:hypothetical protein